MSTKNERISKRRGEMSVAEFLAKQSSLLAAKAPRKNKLPTISDHRFTAADGWRAEKKICAYVYVEQDRACGALIDRHARVGGRR